MTFVAKAIEDVGLASLGAYGTIKLVEDVNIFVSQPIDVRELAFQAGTLASVDMAMGTETGTAAMRGLLSAATGIVGDFVNDFGLGPLIGDTLGPTVPASEILAAVAYAAASNALGIDDRPGFERFFMAFASTIAGKQINSSLRRLEAQLKKDEMVAKNVAAAAVEDKRRDTYGQAVLDQATREEKAAVDYVTSHPEKKDYYDPNLVVKRDPRGYRYLFSGQGWDPAYFRKDYPTLSDEQITSLFMRKLYENSAYDPAYDPTVSGRPVAAPSDDPAYLHPTIVPGDPRSYRYLFANTLWDPRYFRYNHVGMTDLEITAAYLAAGLLKDNPQYQS